MKSLYKPEPVSDVSSLEELVRYVRRELDQVETGFGNCLPMIMEELHEAPSKLRTGLTVLADGTDWNPGAGAGVYTYYGAAWHKLG